MKTKRIITISLTVLVTVMIGLSGLMKAIHLHWSVDGLVKFNLPHSATVLGLMEVTFIVLFAFHQTMRIGFLLLCCYFAGAMAVELSHDGSMWNPGIPLTLLWVTAYLRDSSLFTGSSKSVAV